MNATGKKPSPSTLSVDSKLKWELLHNDPALSAEYLDQSLREGAREEMFFAMRRVVRAHGGIAKIAAETGLNENTLHRTLSSKL
jgi:DNA-binding phage protein